MNDRLIPALSVIIPFHSTTVSAVLESLLKAARISECEIILVSDGLSKTSLTFLDDFQPRLNLILIESKKIGRIGALRNLGIREARSVSCYFIDSDCQVREDVLEKIIAMEHRYPVVRGRNVFIGSNAISRLDAQIRQERYESNPFYAYCPNLVVRKDVFEGVGFYNDQYTYGSDGEFAKRLIEHHMPVHYASDLQIAHDCTDSFVGIFRKWMRYGEARYLRYQGQYVEHRLRTYFPNLYNMKRGVVYNATAALCNVGRAVGIAKAIVNRKSILKPAETSDLS
jgi:glycosyltransferase involved in cell wall biosynthesis